MNPTLRTALLFTALLCAVVFGSYFYSRTVRPEAAPSAAATGTEAPGPTPQELHPDLRAGIEAANGGRLEEAAELFARVPQQDPSYLLARHNLGRALARLGRDREALAAFEELSLLQPNDPATYLDLARAELQAGLLERAETSCLRALELEPGYVPARYALGLIRVARSDLVRAIPAYHRALRADTAQSEFTTALQDLTRLRDRQPDLAAAHYALAFFAKTLGRHDMEITELDSFLALEPEGPAADVARRQLAEARSGSGG